MSIARAALLVTLGALCASCSSFLGWQDDPARTLRGPVPTRTQQPIKLTYLSFRPRLADTQPEGKMSLGVISQYSNLFQNGHSFTEKVVIDGEIWRNSLVFRGGIAPNSDIEFEIPIMYTSNGFLDPVIDWWHKVFGFSKEDRASRPENAYEIDVQKNGHSVYDLEGYHVGLGDIPLILTHRVCEDAPDWPAIAVRLGVEFPTGSESAGFGNGQVDAGGGLLLQHSFGRWTTTGAVDYVHPRASSAFVDSGIKPAEQVDGQLGIEYRWNDASSLLCGFVLETPVTRDIPLKEIDKPILSLDLGVAWDLTMRSQLFAGFTEDVIAESGPDITFNLIWKMQF